MKKKKILNLLDEGGLAILIVLISLVVFRGVIEMVYFHLDHFSEMWVYLVFDISFFCYLTWLGQKVYKVIINSLKDKIDDGQ